MPDKLNSIITDPLKRHDVYALTDVVLGNPNGDPDNEGKPRINPINNIGIISDVCSKRRIRNYWEVLCEDDPCAQVFYNSNNIARSTLVDAAFVENGITAPENGKPYPKLKEAMQAQETLLRQNRDNRMFGFMAKYLQNSKGPWQIMNAISASELYPCDMTISVSSMPQAGDLEIPKDGTPPKYSTLGKKSFLFYALYINYMFYMPPFGKKNKVTVADMESFYDAWIEMWSIDRSASRGMMGTKGLYVFTHQDPRGIGKAQAHDLFAKISLAQKAENPMSFEDFDVMVDEIMPSGVTLTRLVG